MNPSDISNHAAGPLHLARPASAHAADTVLLRDEFHFHPLAIEDATRHHVRLKLEAFKGYYFIVFYCISYDETRGRVDTQAINLFVGQNYLVSAHAGAIGAIDAMIKRWQANEEDFGRDARALPTSC